jgi:hypothetical protein
MHGAGWIAEYYETHRAGHPCDSCKTHHLREVLGEVAAGEGDFERT